MIHAYSENYLDDAMRNLGEAFDFAYAVCHLDLDNFFAFRICRNFIKSIKIPGRHFPQKQSFRFNNHRHSKAIFLCAKRRHAK